MKKTLFFALCIVQTLFAVEKIRVYEESGAQIFASSDFDETAAVLTPLGIRFEKWEASQELAPGADQAAVIEAYRADVDRLVSENGYKSIDVVRMSPDAPKKGDLRKKFLSEHTHTEDEVRFFVEGSGLFYLHIRDKVYLVLCEKGDLISVPAYTTHWFDMGPDPYFTAIRLFIEPSGWIAQYTGSDIADQFPRFE
ncbi:MAG: cupin [Verrucomicrobia bacterium]|nr:cupin [Verrucomicrobiota bacterium]